MASYKLTLQAEIDIEDIWEFTNSRWDKTQAHTYLNKLEKRFIELVNSPDIGKQRYELKGSPMSSHCGRHVIFYRKAKQGIEIIRILHDSMDFPQHLK